MPARPLASLPQQSVAAGDHTHARAQPLSVDTGAIQDDAVTAAKIAPNAVGASELADNAVDNAAMADNSVGSAEIIANSITFDDVVAAFPRGVVARQTPLTVNSSGFTANATTDHSIASVAVDAARLYVVCLKSQWSLSASGIWNVVFHVDGTETDRLDVIDEDVADNGQINARCQWFPTSGTKTVDVRVQESAGAATFTLVGGALLTRQFWIEDIGPR